MHIASAMWQLMQVYGILAGITCLTSICGDQAYTPACYLGWLYHSGSCYKTHETSERWNEAQQVCAEDGGNLLEVVSKVEKNFIRTILPPGSRFWVGLHIEKNGEWRWRDGRIASLPVTTPAGPVYVKPAKCGALSTNQNSSLGAFDCANSLPFICKAQPFDCFVHFDWHVSQTQHCLWFSDDTNTGSWHNIRHSCNSFTSDLATFTAAAAGNLTLHNILRQNVSYWVGLNVTANGLTWLDGILENDTTRFNDVSGSLKGTDRCGSVTLTSNNLLKWELDLCNRPKQFICERTAPLATTTIAPSTPATTITTQDTKSSALTDSSTTFTSAHLSDLSPDVVTDNSVSSPSTIIDRPVSVALVANKQLTRNPRHAQKREIQNGGFRKRFKRKDHDHHHDVHTPPNPHAHSSAHPQQDCCIVIGLLFCKHMPPDMSTQASYEPCDAITTSTPQNLQTQKSTHAHRAHTRRLHHTNHHLTSTRVTSPGITVASTDLAVGSTTSATMGSKAFFTSEVTLSTADPMTDDNGTGFDGLTIFANTSSFFAKIQHMCPKTHSYSCLIDEMNDEDVHTNVLADSVQELYSILLDLSGRQHKYHTKTLFENFFRLVNFFIEGSHSSRWHSLHLSLSDVISVVEPFLDTNVHQLNGDEDLIRSFSHVEILIKPLKRDTLEHFTFDDHDGIGHISDITTTSSMSDDLSLAVVLMKVPVMNVDVEVLTKENTTNLVISPVLSLSAYAKGRQLSLTHNFSLCQTRTGIGRFKLPDTVSQNTLTCAFWNNYTRSWSSYGCSKVSNNNNTSLCHCNHTTNFAILMQVDYVELDPIDEFALEVITYMGCSIALITQVIAITVFTFVGSLNSERVYVHRNLCLAIVGAQVTFLAGIDAVTNRLVCAIVALVLHYFYTAVFIWMLVEGLHLYSKVVQVFGSERSRANYYMVFGWGLPVVLVTISAAADWEGYGTDHSCWLSTTRRTIWAFVGPALAIVIVNLIILAIVVKIVMSSTKKQGEYDQIRAGIKGALLLLPLLGLTWVFGLAAVNKRLVIFQYLFAIFNSLQGFFIFLFHCAFNSEVRQALRRLKVKRSLQKGDLSASSVSQGASVPLSDAWESVRSRRSYPPYHNTQVAPLATTATTTTRLNSLTQSKSSDEGDSPVFNGRLGEENEELSVMYI